MLNIGEDEFGKCRFAAAWVFGRNCPAGVIACGLLEYLPADPEVGIGK